MKIEMCSDTDAVALAGANLTAQEARDMVGSLIGERTKLTKTTYTLERVER